MKLKHRLLAFTLLLAFLLLPTGSVAAAGSDDGKLVIGNSFTLKSGETINGDLVVIGGVAIIESGAKVNGAVVLIGGTLTVDGEVTEDTVLIGGTAHLGPKAHVQGNLTTIGGSLQRDDGAIVDGDVDANIPVPEVEIPLPPMVPEPSSPAVQPGMNLGGNILGQVLFAIGRIIFITLLAMLSMLFLQPQAERVAYAITRQPFIVGGVGMLTIVLAPIAIVILSVTIILIPVAVLAALTLVLAWLLGVIALGLEIGQRFTAAIHRSWPLVLTAGLGTAIVITIMELLNLIPCLGMLISFAIGLVATGGAVITLFGSRQYPPPAAVLPPAPPPPANGPAG